MKKKLSIAIGVAVMLTGMVVAVFGANSYTTGIFYYQSSDGYCLAIPLDKECTAPGPGCTETIGTNPPKQLYRTRLTLFHCDEPLRPDFPF